MHKQIFVKGAGLVFYTKLLKKKRLKRFKRLKHVFFQNCIFSKTKNKMITNH